MSANTYDINFLGRCSPREVTVCSYRKRMFLYSPRCGHGHWVETVALTSVDLFQNTQHRVPENGNYEVYKYINRDKTIKLKYW